jgi:hypothetical protein
MDAKDWIIIRLMVLLLSGRNIGSIVCEAEFCKIAQWVYYNIPEYVKAGDAIRAEKENRNV